MLVKVTPPTMDDLLAASAWFPLLDSGAQARVRDELREVDVPQGGALCRLGDTPLHWYGAIEGRPPVVLVHGEDDAREALAKALDKKLGAEVSLSRVGMQREV